MASFRDFTRRNRKRKSKLHAILVDQMRSMSSLYEIFQNEHGKCRSPPSSEYAISHEKDVKSTKRYAYSAPFFLKMRKLCSSDGKR